jgi:NADH-quinone oxidoreductase subunit I
LVYHSQLNARNWSHPSTYARNDMLVGLRRSLAGLNTKKGPQKFPQARRFHPRKHWQPATAKWYAYPTMGMPSLLRKVFLIDLLQGLKVTFRYQDPKEIYTEQYPMERPQVAERYRGAPRLNVNPDTDETMCIACDLCALACPENLIVVSSARNEHTRRKELTNFTYDLSRCMFCGLCEDACPVDALELTQDFELASYTREGWIWDRETLEKGPSPTQYKK